MEFITLLFNQFNAYSKANPIVAGVVSLWGVGLLTWAFRNVPRAIWSFLKRECTTQLMINNAQIANNMETFNSFVIWLEKSKWMRWSRTMSLSGHYEKSGTGYKAVTAVGIGDGTHFFMYKGWPYWANRQKVTTSGTSYQINYEITITTWGRSRARLMDLIEQFKYEKNDDMVDVYSFKGDSWNRIKSVRKRDLDTVIVRRDIRESILKDIQWFLTNREWHDKRGISYKRMYILHGPSGTGKTSLVKALASHFGWNICILNLSMMSDESLRAALAAVPKKSIVLAEDFDSCSAVLSRSSMVPQKVSIDKSATPVDVGNGLATASIPAPEPASVKLEFITLSGILNAFDGIVTLDEVLVFMTTNVLRDIDPALLRAGRTDKIFELPLLGDIEVREFIANAFDGWQPDPEYHFSLIAGCDLQQCYAESPSDPNEFIETLFRYYSKRCDEPIQLHAA